MVVEYTNAELTDMLLIFSYCQENGRKCVRKYSQKFPTRRLPNHQTCADVERRLCETGCFALVTADYGLKILFTDKASFTGKDVTNLHNEHVHAEENPESGCNKGDPLPARIQD
ncbi:hypothetical protein ILUMI_07749 [Ignelater luminosus]|uniref:DUF4817 domain-containing protein n=1 Tax=Ignelater luminosus TaxID=2038154 RepID=A0A8K0GG15_IGNLU|nr:hypothetical protein ILUMI_07749 [Ignelater luminosus]